MVRLRRDEVDRVDGDPHDGLARRGSRRLDGGEVLPGREGVEESWRWWRVGLRRRAEGDFVVGFFGGGGGLKFDCHA